MDLIINILLALIFISLGFLLSALLSYLRSRPGKTSPAAQPLSSAPVEAVHLWRNRRTQGLTLEMDGQVFHSSGELSEAQRQRLALIAADLQVWFDRSPKPAAPVAPASNLSQTPDGPALPSPAPGEPERHSLNPLKAFSQALQDSVRTTPGAPPQSIVAQIDAILQTRLENSPLADRGIRLVESPTGGMLVVVGAGRYSELSAVPDPDVRSAIREAVAEWERRLGK